MKTLVTGGAGFLGSHIAHALVRRGDEVVVFDHRLQGKALTAEILTSVHAIEGDILDKAALAQAARGCTVIFHCAAMVGVDAYSRQPTKTMETEEVGLRNVCHVAEGARIVYASSSAVYGAAGGSVGLAESDSVAPVSNYGIAKRFNEIYLASQFAEHGLQSVSLRIFNMFGPRQDSRLVIPRIIRDSLAEMPIEIYGDGMQTRDFVYVDDVVAAALAAAEKPLNEEIINVCSGQEVSILGVAKKIIELTGSGSAIMLRPHPQDRAAFEVARCFGDRSKSQKILGQRHTTPLEQGLALTIASMTAR